MSSWNDAGGLDQALYIGREVGLQIHRASCPKSDPEFSLAPGPPCSVTGKYTAGRMADIGSLCGRPIVVSRSGMVVLERAPGLWKVHRAS